MILAMDLSLSCPAFCVAEIKDGKIHVVHLSHVKTNVKESHGKRLSKIAYHLVDILLEYDIKVIVREKGFSRHALTTQTLFKVVGITDLIAFDCVKYENVHEIAPTTVKKLLTGSGRADKERVAEAVKKYTTSDIEFATDDESDAVAVAISYALQNELI